MSLWNTYGSGNIPNIEHVCVQTRLGNEYWSNKNELH